MFHCKGLMQATGDIDYQVRYIFITFTNKLAGFDTNMWNSDVGINVTSTLPIQAIGNLIYIRSILTPQHINRHDIDYITTPCIVWCVLKLNVFDEYQRITLPSSLQYKTHFSRQYNCWSLRCSWSIACRRCSNYIFILNLIFGINSLGKDNCKTRRETLKIWVLVHLILEIWW